MPENGAMSSSGHVNSGGSALDRLSELVHGLFDFAGNTGVFGFGGFLKFFEQTDLVFGQPGGGQHSHFDKQIAHALLARIGQALALKPETAPLCVPLGMSSSMGSASVGTSMRAPSAA